MYKRANSCWMQTPSTQIQISVLTVTMATSSRVQSSFITSCSSTISWSSDVLSAGSCNNLISYGLILMNNLHLRHRIEQLWFTLHFRDCMNDFYSAGGKIQWFCACYLLHFFSCNVCKKSLFVCGILLTLDAWELILSGTTKAASLCLRGAKVKMFNQNSRRSVFSATFRFSARYAASLASMTHWKTKIH